MVINNLENSQGSLQHSKSLFMQLELPSELVTQIEKVPPIAAQKMEGWHKNTKEPQDILGAWSWINKSTQTINSSLMKLTWIKIR